MDEDLISALEKLFRGDSRRVMKQVSSGYIVHHEGALTSKDLQDHINGVVSAAIYLLDENKECSTVCFDVDIPKIDIPTTSAEREKLKKESLLPLLTKLISYLKSVYNLKDENLVIEDTGGRGYHLWLFFEIPQDGITVVNFLNEVKNGSELDSIELFPPAYSSGDKGFSKSLVRLPLGVHKKYNNARSFLISPADFSILSYSQALNYLNNISFVDKGILANAAKRYDDFLDSTKISYKPVTERKEFNRDFIGHVGKMMNFCPAMNSLVHKAERDHDLNHNERFVLAALLKNYEDGEETIHQVLSNCSNYDFEKSSYQISSIQQSAISCKKLQSIEYGICPGWCNYRFQEADENGNKPSPLWFSRLNEPKEGLKTDLLTVPLIEQIAEISNLYQAWQQALQQLTERDIFEDQLSFKLFEEDLWNNLEIIRFQLLTHTWKHNNFLLIQVPKKKEDKTSRPFCSISPREAIVQISILNIIGPKIDSRFNRNSLGNRLAGYPKVDNQIFLDWRKQNGIRELKKMRFAELSPENHFVITDLKQFYEFIKHDKLMSFLSEYIQDQFVLDLIQQFIEAPWGRVTEEYGGELKRIGIPQGPALSALLANLYLNETDTWLTENTVDFVRYVDDIVMVFENKDIAVQKINELESNLLVNLCLTLSPDKTTEPKSVSESDDLINWLDEVRYDFIKSSKTNIALSENEKSELLETLKTIAGVVDSEDTKSMTRYLGLYIRYTERLGDPLMLRTVYATAGFLLQEDRPKHNATCIAINSLIKACNENNNDAWQELAQLYQSREDEYFKIILCQEAGKIIQQNEETPPEQLLSVKVLLLIEAMSVSTEHPIAAAAAINALRLLPIAPIRWDNYAQVAFGDNIFLRPRALWILNQIKPINETTLARLEIKSVFEAEIMATMINSQGTEVFKKLLSLVREGSIYQPLVPRLLRVSIIFKETEVSNLWAIITLLNSQVDLAYYIADKIIAEVPVSIDKSQRIYEMIQFLIQNNLSMLSVELLKFARHHNLITQQMELLHGEGSAEIKKASEDSLPQIDGTELNEPLFIQNYYTHFATNQDEERFYYEYVDGREVSKVGGTIKEYSLAMTLLMASGNILKGNINLVKDESSLVILTPIEKDKISLKDYLDSKEDLSPSMIMSIMAKVINLWETSSKIIGDKTCKPFIPIPCLNTIFIDSFENLYFGLASLTVGSEKRYMGLNGNYFKLQTDDGIIESLGLLFFELVTKLCAVTELVRNVILSKTIDRFSEEFGIVFTGIVKKATRPVIAERYSAIKFMANDIGDWAELEGALLTNNTISTREKFILRILWNLEIHLHRRIISEFNKESLLIYSNKLQATILGNIIDQELHKESWFFGDWCNTYNNSRFAKHVASAQAIAIGDAVNSLTEKLHQALGLNKHLNLSLWLYTTAANIEMEALRRSLHRLINSEFYKNQFLILKDFLLFNVKANEPISVFSSGENARLSEAVSCLQLNVEDLASRLDIWISDDRCPTADWSFDGLIMLLIIVSKRFGLTFNINDGQYADIKADVSIFNKIDFYSLIGKLASAINNNSRAIRRVTFSSIVSSSKAQADMRSENLQILKGVNRYFDLLDEKIHMSFRLRKQVKLRVKQIFKTFTVSEEIIIHENHNHQDILMGKGCPFSLDIEQYSRNNMIPILASFPVITAKMSDNKQYPILINYRFKFFALILTRYRRRNPVLSSFLDVHLSFFLITMCLFYVGLKIISDQNPDVQIALNGFIYSPLAAPVIAYITYTYNVYNKRNPDYEPSTI